MLIAVLGVINSWIFVPIDRIASWRLKIQGNSVETLVPESAIRCVGPKHKLHQISVLETVLDKTFPIQNYFAGTETGN